MKYVQINTVPTGSTGGVMFGIKAEREAQGDECWCMWGRGRAGENDREFNFGSRPGFLADAALTRLDDRAGFHSKAATRRLLQKLDEIDPDIVHLHNLHGYYLNIEMLFEWLAERNQRTLWTLHDCWAFTGHCPYFTAVSCDRWKTGCHDCPQRGEYPRSVLRDASARNYADKRRLFTLLPADRMTLVAPSNWLAGLVGESFLAKYPVEVRRNEVDRTVFKPTPGDFRERHGIGGRFMILGVASPWTRRKGLDLFFRLADGLPKDAALVLVGLDGAQMQAMPEGVIGVGRVEDRAALAAIYSAADLYCTPSAEETFGLTVAEALACGTPVLVCAGSACEETARALADEASIRLFDGTEASLREAVAALMRESERGA